MSCDWAEKPGYQRSSALFCGRFSISVRARLTAGNLITDAGMFSRLAAVVSESKIHPLILPSWTRPRTSVCRSYGSSPRLGADRPTAFSSPATWAKRIFQQPFSWKALGVDIRGRARTLHVNYRTSHQIRMQADRLLGPEVSDVDGNTEDRGNTISVFNGPRANYSGVGQPQG